MVEVVFAGDEHGNLPWATSRIQSVGASGVTGRQGNHGVSLLLSSREKKALNRNYFNTLLWRPALERSGIPDERESGSPRNSTLLREHGSPRGRDHQGCQRVPRPRRSRVHAAHLHT
jgi:hypothetical protein